MRPIQCRPLRVSRLYDIAVSMGPALPLPSGIRAYAPGTFSSAYLQTDPASELAAALLNDMKAEKLDPAQNLKVRYPNMQHSFEAMFTEMPVLNFVT